jgi:hypothetical protein
MCVCYVHAVVVDHPQSSAEWASIAALTPPPLVYSTAHLLHRFPTPQFALDVPVGTDYLGKMSDAERVAWSHDPGLNINATLDALTSVPVNILVDVKLVGFAADGCDRLLLAGLHSSLGSRHSTHFETVMPCNTSAAALPLPCPPPLQWPFSNEALHILDHDLLLQLRSLYSQLDSVALHPDPVHLVSECGCE